MKVTIEYTLPEERDEMELAIKGHEYAAVLATIDNDLRSRIKYNTDLSDEFVAGLQKARDLLHEHASNHLVEIA